MKVRPIDHTEADLFACISDPAASGEWLRRLWESGETSPDWCFVAETDGVPVGRVCYLSFSSTRSEAHILGLHLPWQGDYVSVGRVLLLESLQRIAGQGARSIEYDLPADAPFADQKQRVCAIVGMPLIQTKLRFLLDDAAEPSAESSGPLLWRSLEQVGPEKFIEAIGRVSGDTLDQLSVMMIARDGMERFAREFFAILRDLDDRPSWWELAYDGDGALVGLIIPQRFSDDNGAINYIGVVPERRGRGHIAHILDRGVWRLRTAGVVRIVADTDSQNLPMAAGFRRAGRSRRPGGPRLARFVQGLELAVERRADRLFGPLGAWARYCLHEASWLIEPVAWGQEARADRLAALIAGGGAAASALVKVAMVQPLFREVLAYYDPASAETNLYAFFRAFWYRLPAEIHSTMRMRILTTEAGGHDPAHPPLPDRLARLQSYPDPAHVNGDAIPATSFVGDLEALEQMLHNRLFGLPPIEPSVFHKARA